MRFAVHGPGVPEASPRSHGVPRRDVLGRVHVSVADISAGGAPEDGLALARLRVHLPACRASLARERGVDRSRSAGSFLLQTVDQQAPPERRMPRFSPAFCRTFRPGFSCVPLADLVMFLICKSSTMITSNLRAMSVLTFSVQSLRRSVSQARNLATARLARMRRLDPGRARASLRSRRRIRLRSRFVRPGTRISSPVERAALLCTPRSMPTT